MTRATQENYTNLDEELAEILQPLACQGVTLNYPFFANTFPLAFHLYKATQIGTGKAKGHRSPVTIRQVSWNTDVEPLLGNSETPSVFYATRGDVIRWKKRIKTKVSTRGICLYQPKSFFVDQSPHCLAVALEVGRNGEGVTIHSLLQKLLDGRSTIEVFTDIPAQAQAIIKQPRRGGYTVRIADAHSPADFLGPPPSDSLRVHLYGGPLTAYLRRKPNRLVEFRFPYAAIEKVKQAFQTLICVSPPNSQFIHILGKYHRALFAAAMKSDSDSFWAVSAAYNRLARLQQHRSSFPSAADYVQCLREHYSGRNEQITSPIRVTAARLPRPNPNSTLAFFGCGDLALGLVLPALHPRLRVYVVQVIRGESRIDWAKISRAKTVTLANNIGSEEEYTVVSPSDANKGTAQQSKRLLVIAHSFAEMIPLINRSNWIGTCLGTDGLTKFGDALPTLGEKGQPKKPLLLFENSDDLKCNRSRLNDRYDIVHVLCDRICSNRRVNKDGKGLITTAEQYGEIVVPDRFGVLFGPYPQCCHQRFRGLVADLAAATFASDDDAWAENARSAPIMVRRLTKSRHDNNIVELFRRRKRWLMNSLHHVIAILAADSCIHLDIEYKEMPVFLAELLIDKADPALRSAIDTFVECQIVRMMLAPVDERDPRPDADPLVDLLLISYDSSVLFENLRAYMAHNRWRLGRAGETPDLINRLIDSKLELAPLTKLAARFLEHVREVYTFYATDRITTIGERNIPFRFSAADIELAVRRLKEAYRHVSDKPLQEVWNIPRKSQTKSLAKE
jgi:hypothetical protein